MILALRKKTTEDYLKKIVSEPRGTVSNKITAVKSFTVFLEKNYGTTPEKICEELCAIKKSNGEDDFANALYDILQNWINWNVKNELGPYTLQVRFSNLRDYLYHLGIRINLQDVKQILKFPKKNREERHPLKKSELRDIILAQARYPKRQALYLACSSSGMRIGEALSIRKSDLDFSGQRIRVRIRAEITKTRQARTTFLSKECEEKLKTYLRTLGDNDLVFTDAHGAKPSMLEQNALRRALVRLNLDQKYTTNGFCKITSHSFRAYFFTAAARKHGENYAHKLTGHGGYLMQYDRMTDEEKLKMYTELEPELVVFEQTKNEIKIRQLEETIESSVEKVKRYEKGQNTQIEIQNMILDILKQKGIIPE